MSPPRRSAPSGGCGGRCRLGSRAWAGRSSGGWSACSSSWPPSTGPTTGRAGRSRSSPSRSPSSKARRCTGGAGDLAAQYARNALACALFGALGVGIGALARSQAVAIVAVLIALFVVEPAIAALAPEVGRFGPFGGLPTAVSGIAPEDAGMGAEIDLLPAGVAVLGMLGWIAAAFAAGAALLRRRDVA